MQDCEKENIFLEKHLKPAKGEKTKVFFKTRSSLGSRRTNGIGWGAAIAQWIHLRLPSCHPGFKSQALHLCFYQFIFELCHVEKTKIN